MKNLFMGMTIGVCLTLFAVWGYSSYFNNDAGRKQDDLKKTALKSVEKNELSPARNSESLDKISNGQARKLAKTDLSGRSIQDMLREAGAVSEAVQSFSGLMGEGRSSWQELAQEIRGLKEKGKEGIAELLKIIAGEGSDYFKMIAAGVLGEIYMDTQDPEVLSALKTQVLPLIQGVLDGESNMMLKYQAVKTLGDLGIQGAQDLLVDILFDDTNYRMQLYSMSILREKGGSETADQLLETLQSSQDLSQMMLAAATLGKMNDHLNDPAISEALQASVSKLNTIIADGNQTFERKRSALRTLGALGTTESVESLMRIMEDEAGKETGLERVAVRSLVSSGNMETAASLSRRMSTSSSDYSKILYASAIVSLANRYQYPAAQDLAHSLALPTLKDLSEAGPNLNLQKKAVYALGSVGTSQEIEFLQQLSLNNTALQPTAQQSIRRIQNRELGQGGRTMSRFMGRIF